MTTAPTWPVGGGEAGDLIRAHDWAATPLGPIECWPERLKAAVDMMLTSAIPMCLHWGPDYLQIYNVAAITILRDHHPAALGRPTRDTWAAIWDDVAPLFDRVTSHGDTMFAEDQRLVLDRAGAIKEAFFTFSYSPIRDETGTILGVLNVAVETTTRILAERRRDEAEAAIRSREALNAFRVRLGDQIRASPDLTAAIAAVGELLGEQLQVDRVTYSEVNEASGTATPVIEWKRPGLPSISHAHQLSAFGESLFEAFQAGETIALADVGTDPRARQQLATFRQLDIQAFLAVPVIQTAATATSLAVHASSRRDWTADEIALLREVAERLRDAAERTQAEAMARRYRAVIDQASDAILQTTLDGTVVSANAATPGLLGVPADGTPDQINLFDLVIDANRDVVRHTIVSTVLAGQEWRGEIRLRCTGSDDSLPVWLKVFPIRDDDGTIGALTAVIRDVTAERNRERDALFLAESSDILERVSAPDAIMRVFTERIASYLDLSRCHFTVYDVTVETAQVLESWSSDGTTIAGTYRIGEVLLPGTMDRLAAGQQVVVDDARPADRHARLTALFPRSQVGSFVTTPFHSDGQLVAAMTVSRRAPHHWSTSELRLLADISERIWPRIQRARAEAELRASEQRYRALFQAIDQGFCVLQKEPTPAGAPSDYRCLVTNPAFHRASGLTNVVGRTLRELAPSENDGVIATYDRVVETGEPAEFEGYVASRDRWVDIHVYRVDGPEARRLALLITDITERKRAEEETRQATEVAAYRLALADTLRPLTDPVAIQTTAARLLGERLGTSRTFYASRLSDDDVFHAWQFHAATGVAEFAGRWTIDQCGEFVARCVREGLDLFSDDVAMDPRYSPEERAAYAAADTQAVVSLSLVKNGLTVAMFGVHQTTPRHWAPTELTLIRETAERAWDAVERARAEVALQEIRAENERLVRLYGEILANVGGFLGVFDGELRLVFANAAVLRLWGLEDGMYAGKTMAELGFGPKLEAFLTAQVRHVFATGEIVMSEMPYTRRSGHLGYFEHRLSPVAGADGTIEMVISFSQETTERHLAEAAVRDSEARFRAIADLVPDLLWSNDPDGITTWVNQRFVDYTGRSLDSVAAGWRNLMHPDDLVRMTATRPALDGEPFERERRIRRADGAYRWFRMYYQPERENGRTVRWFGAATDVHDQKLLLEAEREARLRIEERVAERTAELAEANAALRTEVVERQRGEAERTELLRQLIATEEDERRRIAYEVHDGVTQLAAAAALHLDELASLLPDLGDGERFNLDRARDLTRRAVGEARQLIGGLRPTVLDDFGLSHAISEEVQAMRRDGRQVRYRDTLGPVRLAPLIETTLFRAAQEALANVRRHAGPTAVTIRLERVDDHARLSVIDRGVGFDTKQLPASARSGERVGLAGMRERVRLVGGEFLVQSRPGAGTRVRITVPIDLPL